VAVVVAGVIFVGHGQGHDDVYDDDHHSSLQLGGASVGERRLWLPPYATSLRLSRDYGASPRWRSESWFLLSGRWRAARTWQIDLVDFF
jgi:hypothetical protein